MTGKFNGIPSTVSIAQRMSALLRAMGAPALPARVPRVNMTALEEDGHAKASYRSHRRTIQDAFDRCERVQSAARVYHEFALKEIAWEFCEELGWAS